MFSGTMHSLLVQRYRPDCWLLMVGPHGSGRSGLFSFSTIQFCTGPAGSFCVLRMEYNGGIGEYIQITQVQYVHRWGDCTLAQRSLRSVPQYDSPVFKDLY